MIQPEAGENPPEGTPLLRITDLTRSFGGLAALRDVSFEVGDGEILGVIGPNGAGKTTLFNVISGFFRPTNGRVVFGATDITGASPHRIASLGLVRTFQIVRLFDEMTVRDNLLVACHFLARPTLVRSLLGGLPMRRRLSAASERTASLLKMTGLSEWEHQRCRELSHGQKRLVSTAMAIASAPRLLLLDEPLSGLTDEEARNMMDLWERLRTEGMSILVVEHNVQAIMRSCDRIVVLNFGEKLAEGAPTEIQANEDVVSAYLGDGEKS